MNGWQKYDRMVEKSASLAQAMSSYSAGRMTMPREKAQEYIDQMDWVLKWIREHKYYKFYPDEGMYSRHLYDKHMEHYRAGAKYRERCLMGGNRTGKTICGAYETTAHLTGMYPDWWEGRRFRERVDAIAAGKTNETARDIVQKELFGDIKTGDKDKNMIVGTGMIPADSIVRGSEVYKKGVPKLLDYVDVWYRDSKVEKSRLYIKSYEQGRKVFEGTARHSIWLDEEPPFDVYNECTVRTMTVGGIIFLTFTPLDGITQTVMQFIPKDERPELDIDETDEVLI